MEKIRVMCALMRKFIAHDSVKVLSRRFAHTDVEVPSFNHYRPVSRQDPYKSTKALAEEEKGKHNFIFYGVGGTLALMATREVVQTFVTYKSMSADQLALASIEVNLEEIPEGQTKTYEWRGKPVFVRHRSKAEVEKERQVNVAELRDPQTDAERVQKDEWSVVIGVCTHLGCIPFAGLGDFGGYYCPCHGSHYDGSGRIRKGPAPRNLDVPAYKFVNGDKTVVVGSS